MQKTVAPSSPHVDAASERHDHLQTPIEEVTQAVLFHEKCLSQVGRLLRAGEKLEARPQLGPTARHNLWRNTAEWIQSGRLDLRVLTETHDGRGCWDDRKAWDEPGHSYNWQDPEDMTGCTERKLTTRGSMQGTSVLRLYYPFSEPRSDEDVQSTLMHEVQHAADQAGPGERWEEERLDDVFGWRDESFHESWEEVLEEYRARAYTMPDSLGSFEDPAGPGAAALGIGSARQEAILRHIQEAYDTEGNAQWCYGEDIGAWGPSTDAYVYEDSVLGGRDTVLGFRGLVNGLADLTGGNLVNSVRIQDLSEALESCEPERVRHAALALDRVDRDYLASEAAEPFWKQARSALTAEQLEALERWVGR